MTPSELLDAHPGVAALTLDFFDTLVTRTVAQPTHIFALMEEELVAKKGTRWRGFAVSRVIAEREARKVAREVDEHIDVTLSQIVSQLARSMGLSLVERDELMALECRTELDHSLAVDWGLGICLEAQRRGLPVFVVSDNYMPADHLAALSARVGASIGTASIFVSCERGAMKQDGSIWPQVIAAVGSEPGRILHVGDLPDADGSIPAGHGIITHVNGAMRCFHRDPLNTSPAVLPLSRVEASHRLASAGVLDPIENLASGAIAMIVAGQVLDVLRRSEEVPVAGIHFTARDGYLASKVYGRVQAARPALPPGTYTEVSRSMVWRASLGSVNEASVVRMIGDDETLSVDRLSSRFGCALVAGAGGDGLLDAVSARGLVLANSALVEAACTGLRERLLRYLDLQGVTDPGHHLLVDLGWSGSVIAGLAGLVRAERGDASTYEGRLTALYWDATGNRRRVSLHGFAMDQFSGVDDNIRLLGTVRLFESLLTAPHGSVSDYHDGSARRSECPSTPVIGGMPWEQFERLVVDAASAIVLGSHPQISPQDVTEGTVWAAMMQVASSPTDDEVDRLGMLLHDSSIDHGGNGTPLVAPFPEGVGPTEVEAVYESLIKHHWLQGSLQSWWREPSRRWVADEIRRRFPAVAPQWVRT